MEYIFTLRYRVDHADGSIEDLVDRLAEAGCDDVLIGLGRPGSLALEFSRNAKNAKAAMRSALQDVKCAMPVATLIEAGPVYAG